MDKYKYKLRSSATSRIITKELASKDYSKAIGALELPNANSKDLLGFWSVMVTSGPNKNLAYFDQKELCDAYFTIPLKAVTLEHSDQDVQGFIYNHAFINGLTKNILAPVELSSLSDNKLRGMPLEVIIGSYLFCDRFPSTTSRIDNMNYSVSMEAYFEKYAVRVGDLVLTPEEAEALGLSSFIQNLIYDFPDEASMIKAHTLRVVSADNSQQNIVVYKQLQSIWFNGVGLVQDPACEVCQILGKCGDKDEESLKLAASQISSEVVCDLTKLDRYMKAYQEDNKIIIDNMPCPCRERTAAETIVGPAVPPSMNPPMAYDPPPNSSPTYAPERPMDVLMHPGRCVQYREMIYKYEHDNKGNPEPEIVEKGHWCLRNNVDCAALGNCQDRKCVRWHEDENGTWWFDPDDNYQAIEVDGVDYFDRAGIEEEVRKELKKEIKQKYMSKLEVILARHRVFLASLGEE